MYLGSTPAEQELISFTMGVQPSSLAFSGVMTTTAAAASLIPEALAAVVTPSGVKTAFILDRVSMLQLRMGCSSVSMAMSPFFLLWMM